MKRCLILALAGVVASAATLSAIPDRVGSFLFGIVASTVEDFALNPDTWGEEKFSTEWEDKSVKDSDEEVYQLNRPFIVFGKEAKEVKAIRLEGELQRFLVTYSPEKDGKTFQTLHRNIEAYTGEKMVESPRANEAVAPGLRCHYNEFEIYLGKRKPDSILVAIRRVNPST